MFELIMAAGLGVAPVVEHLPSKHEALTSNPNTVRKKKNNNG
jgi:hypothetical protein